MRASKPSGRLPSGARGMSRLAGRTRMVKKWLAMTVWGSITGSGLTGLLDLAWATGRVGIIAMLANLTALGIGRLFAEGGTVIHTHLTSRRSDLVPYLKSR